MPSPRKIAAKLVLCTGLLLGAGAAWLWGSLLWPEIAAIANHRTAMNSFWLMLFGGLGLLGLVTWPFSALAEFIDPPPGPGSDDAAAAKAARQPCLAHPKVSRPRKQP